MSEALHAGVVAAVNYPEESFASWVRDAIRLRLELENDREMIANLGIADGELVEEA